MNFTGNPIGVQLYSLREECKIDFPGTLKKVAEIGIGSVEFAGLHGHKPEEIKEVLAEAKLKSPSCHVGLNELESNFDQIIKDYVTVLGCKYVIVPNGPRKYDDGGKTWQDIAAAIHKMKQRCDNAGVKLAYHNHAFEFENALEGKTAFDVMFHDNPDTAPICEMDICWVAKGKHDPVNEMRRLKGRVKLLHVKDLDPGPPPRDTEVGSGIIQWNAIYKTAAEVGVEWLIIERDNPIGSGLESIKQSLAYLKSQGLEKVTGSVNDGVTSASGVTSGTV